ncbi:MAG: hypothetical protein ABGY08_02470 [Gammaproteobacteria bacterium]
MNKLITIKVKILYVLYLLCFFSIPAVSGEKYAWFNPTENLRLATDFSVRPQYDVKNDHFSHIESVGFDLHKVFSSASSGDFGTLIVQGYFNKLNNVEKHPPFFKGEDDLKFICRICNFNVAVLNKGLLNIRIGHYETPFGLEFNMDTNGTLRQYSNGRDLAGKLDWGITVNGKSSLLGYEISLGRGVGVDWTSDYSSYIASGRLEITDDYSSFIGFSAFHGHIKSNNPDTAYIDRTRIGLDASTQAGPFTFLSEVSVGQDNSTDRFNTLIEIDLNDSTDKVLGFFQLTNTSYRIKHQHWETLIQTHLGIRYTPNRSWTYSGQWTHDIENYQSAIPTSTLRFQVRYRFGLSTLFI